MVNGAREHVEQLRDEVSAILAPLGLRLSPAKTRVAHLTDGIDFLGFHLQWRRKRGTTRWYVYTFIADRPIKALKARSRAMTNKTSKADPGTTLIRLPPDHARLGLLLPIRRPETRTRHPRPTSPGRGSPGG